ncbi:MAG: hypothetical protein AB7V13_22945, partial [Pseudorhodoplanes sp.]
IARAMDTPPDRFELMIAVDEDGFHDALVPGFPKFVIRRSNLLHELRKPRGISKSIIPLPLSI